MRSFLLVIRSRPDDLSNVTSVTMLMCPVLVLGSFFAGSATAGPRLGNRALLYPPQDKRHGQRDGPEHQVEREQTFQEPPPYRRLIRLQGFHRALDTPSERQELNLLG